MSDDTSTPVDVYATLTPDEQEAIAKKIAQGGQS